MMKESTIEKSVCDYARAARCLVYKFTSPGKTGVPDRMFITEHGLVFFIEFKNESGKLSAIQKHEIKKIRNANVKVFIVNNDRDGFQIINALTR